MMWRSADDMPLEAMIRLLCDNDPSALYRNGERPADPDTDLEREVADAVSLEFMDSVSTDPHRSDNAKKREMERMNLVILGCVCQIPADMRSDETIAKILRSLKVRLSGDNAKDITLIESRIAECGRKMRAVEEPESGKGSRIDRRWFADTLSSMSVYFKMHISSSVTVMEFCSYLRRYETSVRNDKAAADRRKTNRKSYGRRAH